jgi:hypothetical protein
MSTIIRCCLSIVGARSPSVCHFGWTSRSHEILVPVGSSHPFTRSVRQNSFIDLQTVCMLCSKIKSCCHTLGSHPLNLLSLLICFVPPWLTTSFSRFRTLWTLPHTPWPVCIADCIAHLLGWWIEGRYTFGCRASRAAANPGSGTAQSRCWWRLVVTIAAVDEGKNHS